MDIFPSFGGGLIFKGIKYVLTDQEKEGRELGKVKAAEVYEPVLEKLEQDLGALKVALSKEVGNFNSQYEKLRITAEYYLNKKEEILDKIERLKDYYPEHDDLIDTMMASGSGMSSMTGMIGSTSLGFFGYFLEKEMDEKRKKFAEIEFEEMAMGYEKKIEEIRKEMDRTVKGLKALKEEDKQKLEIISQKVNAAVKDYENALEKYNFLESML